MEEQKTEGQKLQEKLSYRRQNAWEKSTAEFKEQAFQFCEGYKTFLNLAKTERVIINEIQTKARQNGFLSLDEVIALEGKLQPGMKVYQVNRGKSVVLSVIGSKPVREGINIIGAHIDSPRIDIKQNPLYEDTGMALLKTHYYGGIKKYQWVTVPLALHGIIIKGNGESVQVNVGEDEDDPVFTITDLLPHLASEQLQKKAGDVIPGEGLNLLIGSLPFADEKVEGKVKLNILKILNEKYGITEEDFVSSELQIVPAFKARDLGLDRSMIGAYGQDDRVCVYTALKAILDVQDHTKTIVCIFTDKEEIGSVGNTGAKSRFFENFIANLCALNSDNYTDIDHRNALSESKMLVADVTVGEDPNFGDVQDKNNASYLGSGVVLQKYTGIFGKFEANDANPEFIGELRKMFNENDILWQTAELGKVDQGGGGSNAQYMANLGIEAIDCGVPLLSMHSPFEVTSKIDIYIAYNAFKAFMAKI